MKTRRILAASTAALLSFASVAVVANATGEVDIEYDEDGVDIGSGVLAFINEKDESKFEDYTLKATQETLTGTANSDGDTVCDTANDPVVKDLSKSLKKELGKVKTSDIEIWDIDLANGIYSEEKAPAAVKITINVGFDAKVYHVNGDSVELLKSSSKKLADGTGYEVTFTTTNFSPFIFTTAELKNAGATDKDNDPVDESSASSDAANAGDNAETGIALAIAPVVLAAGAVAVVALKKKH